MKLNIASPGKGDRHLVGTLAIAPGKGDRHLVGTLAIAPGKGDRHLVGTLAIAPGKGDRHLVGTLAIAPGKGDRHLAGTLGASPLFRSPLSLLSFVAVVGLMACVVPGLIAQEPPVKKSALVTLPFELVASNHMVVQAKINDKGPFRLVFDSGAPISLLGNRAAEESGTISKDAPKSFLMAMRGEGKIKALEVGDLKAKDIPVIILDHPTLKALGGFLGKPLDGIIGFTFFARYRTTIDYQAKLMTLEPVDYEVRDLLKELPDRLAGPKIARKRVLAPSGLWGLTLGEPVDNGTGVAIKTVRPGSPAELAGLKVGDVLTTLDGRWTSNVTDAYTAANGAIAGQSVDIVLLRAGQDVKVQVKPLGGI
jgi:membrane-associated protease RseP (regulator of RpoE activity)